MAPIFADEPRGFCDRGELREDLVEWQPDDGCEVEARRDREVVSSGYRLDRSDDSGGGVDHGAI